MEEKIKSLLIEMFKYTEVEARETAKDICSFSDEDLRDAVRQLVYTGEYQEIIEGKYTTSGLMKSHSFEYPAALVFIDWYRHSPIEAENALQWMRQEGFL